VISYESTYGNITLKPLVFHALMREDPVERVQVGNYEYLQVPVSRLAIFYFMRSVLSLRFPCLTIPQEPFESEWYYGNNQPSLL
jgi:hypothetical protein